MPRPTAVLLVGSPPNLGDAAEEFARERLDVLTVVRVPRGTKRLDPAVVEQLRKAPFDYLLNYLASAILTPDIIRLPTRQAINFHPAPPRWPGIGSASYALYAGDRDFGATAHLITDVVDGGPILKVARFPIEHDDTCDRIFERAQATSLVLFREVVTEIASGERLEANGERWERRAATRRDFDRWLVLPADSPPDEIARRVRAARSEKFPGPYLQVGTDRFGLVPARRDAPPQTTPGIPWWEPRMTGEELDRVREVIDANFLNDGDTTTQFERRIAARVGARHAICVTSGTAALFLALVAAGVQPGDDVLVPDLTFIASANAVTMAGARPVLVDVDPATLTIDPEAARRAITPRTRAIMPVHVSGRAADLVRLAAIAQEHRIAIVEDAAEAFCSQTGGRALGTIGLVGCLSFSPNKTITTGQGGAILTNDDATAQRLRELKDQGRPVRGTGGDDIHASVGFNFKFTNLQAAVGLAQLTRLDERLDRQRRIQQVYRECLAGVRGISLLPFRLDQGETPLWTDALIERRDSVDRDLERRDMHCRRFWFPLHTQAPYRASDGLFPHATRLGPQALWLPSAFTLSDDQVRAVATEIRASLARA